MSEKYQYQIFFLTGDKNGGYNQSLDLFLGWSQTSCLVGTSSLLGYASFAARLCNLSLVGTSSLLGNAT